MPVKYIPYTPNTVEGQAILDNITRTQRVLRYRDNGQVFNRIKRGMPYYEVETIEQVGGPSDNLVIRGECISACAYLKEQNIKVDLVYIDPPFASGADYAKKVYIRRNPKLAEKIKEAEQEMDFEGLKAFEETMYGDIWKKEDYLNWMYENLQAIKSVMSDIGAIYIHIDWRIVHYLKVIGDEIFGEDNFMANIIWRRIASGRKAKSTKWLAVDDIILIYTKGEHAIIPQYLPYSEEYKKRFVHEDENGKYFWDNIGAFSQERLKDLENKGRVKYPKNPNAMPRIKNYLHEGKGVIVDNIWTDIPPVNSQANEDTGYATQKPEALLKRILNASSIKGMVVADFFGGSGVTAKVANDLGRKFIHTDIGINAIQTTRDRLTAEKINFTIKEIKDGVSLFRNPQQTMDKLAKLITGLQRKVEGVSNFWFGALNDSKLGTIPVFVPDLIDSKQKILDIPTINRIINEEIQNLNVTAKKVIVYYIDIDDEKELRKFIKDNNVTTVDVELKDLKNLLHETVVNDKVDFTCEKVSVANKDKDLFDSDDAKEFYEVSIDRFVSDRLLQKIGVFNEKGNLQSLKSGKIVNPINISEDGLELIEFMSLDCQNKEGQWFSSVELKIDKLGFVINNGEKSKDFWDGKILSQEKPLRIKIRNISGDEIVERVE